MSDGRAVIEELRAARRAGDYDRIASLMHDGAVIRQAASLPWGGEYRGVAGMREMYERIAGVTADGHRFTALGERTLVRFRATVGTVRQPVAELYELQNGLIRRIDPYWKDTKLVVDEIGGDAAASVLAPLDPPAPTQMPSPVVRGELVGEIETMLEFLRRFGEGDVAGVCALVAPEGTFHEATTLPWGGDWTGPQGFGALLQAMLTPCELTLDSVTLSAAPADQLVAIEMEGSFTSRATQERVLMSMLELYTVRDGLIRDADVYYKDTAAISALLGAAVS